MAIANAGIDVTMVEYQGMLQTLQFTWHKTIPVSEFMAITPLTFDGAILTVRAPLEPNINLHQTMFAGSIYTLMTLTGWGMVWLQQQLAHVEGDIVLADAHIRYLSPVTSPPVATVRWENADLTRLSVGRKAKAQLRVHLFCDDQLCAEFTGIYVSVPVALPQ